jgi:thiol-disulfide isomerase/thioredoxin
MNRKMARHLSIVGCAVLALLILVVSGPRAVVSSAAAQEETEKIVLAEQFTGTWCPYCPGSSGALERVQKELGREKFVVLSYHCAAGRTDPFDNPDSNARLSFYQISGFPTVVFNGLYKKVGGSSDPGDTSIDESYTTMYNMSKQRSTPFSMTLTGVIESEESAGYVVNCEAVVTSVAPMAAPTAVRFVVYEDNLNYRAPNGESVFDWVVRKTLEPVPLTITEPGQQQVIKQTIALDSKWKRQNLGVVALVQRTGIVGKAEVFQAASVDLQ